MRLVCITDLIITYLTVTGLVLLAGDANRDGKVNIGGFTYIQKYLAGIKPPEEIDLISAGFNMDNDFNIKDATNLQKHLSGVSYK